MKPESSADRAVREIRYRAAVLIGRSDDLRELADSLDDEQRERLGRVFDEGLEQLGTAPQSVAQWLTSPARGLGYKIPLDLVIADDAGAKSVCDMFVRIAHGIIW